MRWRWYATTTLLRTLICLFYGTGTLFLIVGDTFNKVWKCALWNIHIWRGCHGYTCHVWFSARLQFNLADAVYVRHPMRLYIPIAGCSCWWRYPVLLASVVYWHFWHRRRRYCNIAIPDSYCVFYSRDREHYGICHRHFWLKLPPLRTASSMLFVHRLSLFSIRDDKRILCK